MMDWLLLESGPAEPAGNMALDEALPFFTSNVASLLRFETKGRIAVGMDADLLLLGHDLSVDALMARGRWMVRGGQPVISSPFEGARP